MRIVVFTLLGVGILGLVFLEQLGGIVVKNFYMIQQRGEYFITNPSDVAAVHAKLMLIFISVIILGCGIAVYKYFSDIQKSSKHARNINDCD